MPDDGALDRARKLVGYRNVEIRTDKHSVNLKKKGMQLDLSGVAKGYSAEQALLVLRSRGITRALVDAGGDIVVSDPPPGREGWRVAVEKPGPDTGPVRPILLINSAIATSGGTYQYSEIQGKRYSHIVNPKTGVGSTVPASATVIAPDGMTADALATALCVMPPEEGLKLVESFPGVSALITIETPDGLERYRSSGFPP